MFMVISRDDHNDAKEVKTLIERWENIMKVVSDGSFFTQIILAYDDTAILSDERFCWTQIARIPASKRESVIKKVADMKLLPLQPSG
jgi:hypothetical protein